MKFQLVSDLHIDFWRRNYSICPSFWKFGFVIPDNAEDLILLLAGDTAASTQLLAEFLDEVSARYKYVVFIAGNHEYYGHDMLKYDDTLFDLAMQYDNVYFLDNETISLFGVTIFGATLWTDLNKSEEVAVTTAKYSMNDFRQIGSGLGRLFSTKEWLALHEESLELLCNTKADIVMTHHLPTKKLVNLSRYGDTPLNYAYFSHLDEVVANSGAKIWLAGHTHNVGKCTIGDTEVIVNCLGYPGENTNLETLIVEV